MGAIGRREFLVGAAGLAAAGAAAALTSGGGVLGPRPLGAQQPAQSNFGPMDQQAYRPTYRPPKPGATPSMTNEERDLLEKKLKCQCTCTLDVYTCRTTDFTCSVSPAMHQDVMRLVEGGYSADEILDAFVATYGEVALTAPKKEGFNWAGYLAPGIALATGGVVLTMLLRKWSTEAQAAAQAAGATRSSAPMAPQASAEDLARLERALREEDR